MPSPLLGIQTLGSMLADTEATIDWIVDGVIARGGKTFLVARPGAGKTLLTYYIASCVLTGNPVFGTIAVQRGAALFIDLDMHRRGIAKMRAVAALRGHGLTDEEIAAVPLYIAAQLSSIDLRLDDVRESVIGEISAIPDLALVVLDTWSDLHHGKEGSPDDMNDTASGALAIATQCNCGVVVNHHQRKNGGDELEDVRGASSITAKADAVFLLKTERDEGGNPGTLTLLQRKARLTEEARPLRIAFAATGDIDGNLESYTYALTDAAAKAGRPPSTSNEAAQIATNLLWEQPDTPKPELIKHLIAAGIPKSTAYRVAGVKYSQKYPDLGVTPIMGNEPSPATQGETAFPSGLPGGSSGNGERPIGDDAAPLFADSEGVREESRGGAARTDTVADDVIADAWSALVTWASSRCHPFTDAEEEAARIVALRIIPGELPGRTASRVFEQERAWRTGSAGGGLPPMTRQFARTRDPPAMSVSRIAKCFTESERKEAHREQLGTTPRRRG